VTLKITALLIANDQLTRCQDENDVEAALLLLGKKFPPMLPRELRVSRCKAPHKTARALEAKHGGNAQAKAMFNKKATTDYIPKLTLEAQTLAGRASKLLGRSGARQVNGAEPGKERRARPPNTRKKLGVNTGFKTPEDVVFEGRRASVKDGKPKDLKFKGSKSGTGRGRKSAKTGRGATRAAKWRAQGGPAASK
jgi:nucleolar protein 12